MRNILFGTLSVILFSCGLFEDLEKKSKDEKTIELMSTDGNWKADSIILKIFPANDSVFLNNGTLDFQNPGNSENPGFGTGYLIHTYSKNGKTKIDTMAWIPSNIGIINSDIVDLTIYQEDANGQSGLFNGLQLAFKFNIQEKTRVSLQGDGGGPASSGSALSKVYKRYHLTR